MIHREYADLESALVDLPALLRESIQDRPSDVVDRESGHDYTAKLSVLEGQSVSVTVPEITDQGVTESTVTADYLGGYREGSSL